MSWMIQWKALTKHVRSTSGVKRMSRRDLMVTVNIKAKKPMGASSTEGVHTT
jgi:hypothetical protein